MTKPTVFISYSHKDEAEKDALMIHLGVLQSHGLIELWNDDRILAGGDWAGDISEAMAGAKVAILLVTANFLTSNFILGQEVPALLKRRRDEGLTVFPIIAKPCAWQTVKWLSNMNVRPKNGTSVWRDGGRYVDEELATIATEVAAILDREAGEPVPPPTPGAGLEELTASRVSAATPDEAITPAPSPVSSAEMSLEQKMTLVDALLACDSIQDRDTRDLILNELPTTIKNNIKRSPADKPDVVNIVNTCLNYSDGLQQLVELVNLYENDSLPLLKVKQLLN